MQITVYKIVFIEGSVIFLACYGSNNKNGIQEPIQKKKKKKFKKDYD